MIRMFHGSPVITFCKGYILQFRLECSMAAVIGPVRIQNADLRHGRVSLLLIPEVILNMHKILKCHGKVQGIVNFL